MCRACRITRLVECRRLAAGGKISPEGNASSPRIWSGDKLSANLLKHDICSAQGQTDGPEERHFQATIRPLLRSHLSPYPNLIIIRYSCLALCRRKESVRDGGMSGCTTDDQRSVVWRKGKPASVKQTVAERGTSARTAVFPSRIAPHLFVHIYPFSISPPLKGSASCRLV